MAQVAEVIVAAALDAPELERPIQALVDAALEEAESPIEILATSREAGSLAARVARWVSRAASQLGLAVEMATPEDVTVRSAVAGAVRAMASHQAAPLGSGARIGVSELLLEPNPTQVDQDYAIRLWSRALPAHRQVAQQTATDTAAAQASAAASARPLLSVLIGATRRFTVIVASPDLLGAEVTGRALRAAIQPAGDTGVAPWEEPIIQRTTELLRDGALHPNQIRLRAEWLGPVDHPAHERFHALVGAAARRAGVASPDG